MVLSINFLNFFSMFKCFVVCVLKCNMVLGYIENNFFKTPKNLEIFGLIGKKYYCSAQKL